MPAWRATEKEDLATAATYHILNMSRKQEQAGPHHLGCCLQAVLRWVVTTGIWLWQGRRAQWCQRQMPTASITAVNLCGHSFTTVHVAAWGGCRCTTSSALILWLPHAGCSAAMSSKYEMCICRDGPCEQISIKCWLMLSTTTADTQP